MNIKIQKTILAGIIATTVMTAVMMMASMMGMPKMSPPSMLSEMLSMPIFIGWVMHFMIGISFAFVYTFICIFKHKIKNIWLKGVVFGVVAFIIAQIMMGIMGQVFPMPKMEGSMILTFIASLMDHIIFGMVVVKIIGESYCLNTSCKTKIS